MTSRQRSASDRNMIIEDDTGRRLELRNLSALDKLRLFKAAGPHLAHNQPWLGMAVLACSVAAIDDVPVPMPANEALIEALVARLGDGGIAAVAAALAPDAGAEDSSANAKN